MNAKGAFQLSMSLIVIVVFAVILLGLSKGWIQGIFDKLNPIITKVTEKTI